MKTLLETEYYRLVEARHGRFLVNPRDIYIGRSLIEYGEYSESEWRVLERVLPEGGIAIEAGANIGALTVPIAKKVGQTGGVFAFEPQTGVYQLLAANVALNDLPNVIASTSACGEAPGWTTIKVLNPARENNYGGLSLEALRGGSVKTRVERLDEAVDPPRLDLIKADVEGMEAETLRGARGLIEKFRPALYLENDRQERSRELIDLIQGFGYRMWWHLPFLFHPKNHAGRQDNIFGLAQSRNMLCLPEERPANVRALTPVAGPEDHPAKWEKPPGAG